MQTWQHWLGVAALAATLAAPRVAFGYAAIVNKTDHSELHLVPTPGKVTIDGDLKDWDLSGAILMFLDESSKTIYSVRGAMMYDADALYIAAQVKDPTPMVNHYTFGGEYDMSWNADAVQLRFLAFPGAKSEGSLQTGGHIPPEENACINHITLWYSTLDQKAGYFASHTVNFREPELNPAGVSGAYLKDADGKGYALEYRIPWAVLRAPRALTAGDTVKLQWQLHWGNDLGQGLRTGMTDVRSPAGSDDLGYMGPRSWGKGIFEAKGNLKLDTGKGAVGRAPGHIPVAFTLPADAKVSLAVCDAQGRIVRTGLGAEPFKAGAQAWQWDGLDDYDRPLPAGKYQVKLLTHAGVTQKFVCDIGVSGTPPYQTEDGKGGWAGDYGYPSFVAIRGDAVFLGTASAEAAPVSIRCDLEGRKLYGSAAGGAAATIRGDFVYVMHRSSGKLQKVALANGYLSPFAGGKPEAQVLVRGEKEDQKTWGARVWSVQALATVDDTTLVVSSLADGRLVLVDLATGAPKGEALLPAPRGLAVDAAGTLYAVSGKAVGRCDLKTQQFTPIAADLDEPRQLACDAAGKVYVSLQGQTMQVWQLGQDGKPTQKFGKTGGRPALGKFDPAGMLNPGSIAVDKHGRVWVAESDGQPKRYSVWNPDGTLYKDYFGSLDYATTAYVDATQPDFVYAQAVRYAVDFAKGTWRVDSTVLRPGKLGDVALDAPAGHAGAVIVNLKGRKFLVGNPLVIHELIGDRWVPRLTDKWIDMNNDGQAQPEEMQDTKLPKYYWTPIVDQGLNLYNYSGTQWHAQGGAKVTKPYAIVKYPFAGFNAQGGLQYGAPQEVAVDSDGGAIAAWMVDDAGATYALVSGGSLERGVRAQGSGHRVVKFAPDGRKLWEYHNVHCAFAWASEAYTPGYLVGAVCFSRGVPGGPAGLIGVTGYYGQYFLLDTQDGLFVAALGEDQRSPYTLDQHMVLTENFNGTLFARPDGKTYFLGGDADCRLWELGGLDTIKRQALSVTVTDAQATQARANAQRNLEAAQLATGKKMARIVRLKGARADGKYDEWAPAPALTLFADEKRSATAQWGYDDQALYLRFQVVDDSPLLNTPTDYKLLFKTGDAVELQLGTELGKRGVQGQNVQNMAAGDLRLILARTAEGKVVATIYRPRIADAKKPNANTFESPTGKQVFDEVLAVNDLPVHVTADKESYVVEAAVPWTLLGLAPKSGLALIGDLGVIYGNQGGTKNAIRYYWADKSPEVSINNDIPSEVRLHPNDWGKLTLE